MYGKELPDIFRRKCQYYEFTVLGHTVKANYRFWGYSPNPDPKGGAVISHIEFIDTPVVSGTGYRSHFFNPDLLAAYSSPEEAVKELALSFMRENGTDKPALVETQLSLF